MIEHDCTVIECQWKDIGDGYAATSCGGIFSKNKNGQYKRLYGCEQHKGHLRVCMKRGGKQVSKFIHVLICEAFIGPRPPGMQCCHGNGNPQDNRVENLRWGTHQDNCDDALRHGTIAFGEDCVFAKLTWDQVATIRREYTGYRGQTRELASRFGVSGAAIYQIVNGLTWTGPKRRESVAS